jgi:hypothetical protein
MRGRLPSRRHKKTFAAIFPWAAAPIDSGGKQMKFIASLLTVVLGSALLLAQDVSKAVEMSGTICDSKCVNQSGGHQACNLTCSEKSDDAVFIDDNGKVSKIANPDKVKGYKGKHVKAKCKTMEDDSTWFYSILG